MNYSRANEKVKSIDYEQLPFRFLLRIHISEKDRVDGKPLYKALIDLAMEMEMFSAVALRGIMSYDRMTGIHSVSPIRLALDLPLVVEVLDEEEKAQNFVRAINERKWLKEAGHISIERIKYL